MYTYIMIDVISLAVRYRILKLQNVKIYSDKLGVPNYKIPVIHALMITLVGAGWITRWITGVWESVPHYNSSYSVMIDGILPFLPLILWGVAFFTVMDHIAKGMVYANWVFIKIIMKGISKIDYKIWRKYGKESYIANIIWKTQQKWLSISKPNRRRIIALLIMGAVMHMTWRIMY